VTKTRTATGEVVLPELDYPAKAAELVVKVEDISRADAPSVVVGEQRQRDVALHGGATIPFTVEIPAALLDERHLYSACAHVDMSGSGTVKRGDLVSTQTYPVLTRGYGDRVRIAVQRV
jgi:putative lipoprotein